VLREERPGVDGVEEAVTLLLIEDNDDDVEIVRRALERSGVGARLQVARDGLEGMEALRTGARDGSDTPVVLLLDLVLSASHGVDVIQAVQADRHVRETPIVVLTGSSDIGLLRRCFELGINMYLLKPLDVADVMNILLGVRRYWAPVGQPRRLPARQSEAAMQRS